MLPSMTRDEHEQHKRRLEEDLGAGCSLLEMTLRDQVRALKLGWAATGGYDVAR